MTIRDFAIKWHGDQKYGGLPYVDHLDMVWVNLFHYDYVSPNYCMAAYCHDILEDTAITHQELVKVTNMDVYEMVWAVTGLGDTRAERTEDTIHKLRLWPDAIPLKMADRLANMRFSSHNSRKHINMYIDELPKYGTVFFGPMYDEMKKFQKVPE